MKVHAPVIVVFGAFSRAGGIQRVLANMIPVWVEEGYSVEVVGFRDGVLFYQEELPDSVRFFDLGVSGKWSALIKLWKHLRALRPVAVISTMHIANMIVSRLAFLPSTGARRIVSVHNSFGRSERRSAKRKKRKLREVRNNYRHADGVVAVSNGVKNSLLDEVALKGVPVYCVLNGVITESVFSLAGVQPDHPWLKESEKIPTVLTVGRLSPQKEQHCLMEAVAQVRSKKEVRLIILGEGPLRSDLEELAKSLGGLDEWISMPGFVDNPYAWMARASCFVLSSRWEGFGNVLAEGLALGVPVVSTDYESGARDILSNGKYGRIVDVGDTPALADAISEVLDGDIPSYDAREAVQDMTARSAAKKYLDVLVGDELVGAVEWPS